MAGQGCGSQGIENHFVTGEETKASLILEMSNRKLDNKTLDRIGHKLFENGRLGEHEIDSIISKPGLFDTICKRIAEQAEAPRPGLSSLLPVSLKVAAFPAVVIVAIVAGGLLRSERPIQTVNRNPVPEAFPENAPPVSPPQDEVEELSPGGAIKANFRVPVRRPARQPKRSAPVSRRTPSEEFYAISYTGEDHTTSGGRIVRVELNRSALFALGVNLPLENDSETVRADLLIGSDGVTRGLRVVK